jgi:O-antigen/teichoic acid export membrane protein
MFIRAATLVIPAQLIKMIISLILQIVVARLLLPEGRGVYATCMATSVVLLVLTYFGNEFGIRYLLVRKRITSAQAFRYLLLTAACSLAFALGLAILAKAFDLGTVRGITLIQIMLACFLSFSQLVSTQLNVFMTIRGEYLQASSLAIAEEIFKLFAIITLMIRTPTVEMALTAAIIGNLIITIFSIFRYKFYIRDFAAIRSRDIRFIYRYGIRSFTLNLSNISNAHMGTLVLAGIMSNSQIGIYNIAFGLITRLQVLPDALNRVLVPASMASRDEAWRFGMVQVSVTALLAFSLLVVPILALFNKPIIVLMFGHEYAAAGPVALILAIGFSLKIIAKPIEAHFNEIAGNPTIIATIQVFGSVMMASLTYLGAILFGLSGASIGSSIALVLSAIALFLAYSRSTQRAASSIVSPKALALRLRKIRPDRS